MAPIRLLALLTLLLTLSACSLLPEQVDETADWSAQRFFSEAQSAMADSDYEQAAEYYEGLEARYPFGRYALQAQINVAYAHYKNGNYTAALAAIDRFIKLHPRNPHVDYAYYLKGVINFTRNLTFTSRFIPVDTSQRDPGTVLDSFNDFEELVKRFPDSKYSADARRRMVYLRNNLAAHEVHVARYYMKRGAYVAAAKRAGGVIERYQRTPSMREALEIMVAAYTELGLDDLAADAQRVLEINDQKGNFKLSGDVQIEESWGKKAWDFLELDQN